MSHRFYSEQPVTTDRAILAGPEAHHLQHVMRAKVGDEVILFDGSGWEFDARVARLSRAQVELEVTGSRQVDLELATRIVVGVALPKADRQRWLMEKLVELGVARVVPLRTQRSVVHPDQSGLSKLRRAVIEATKQCGRTRLLEVAELMSLTDYLQSPPANAVKWVGDPVGTAPGQWARGSAGHFLAVGPEGGWSDDELSWAQDAGWQVISLGERLLRVETACLVFAALVMATSR